MSVSSSNSSIASDDHATPSDEGSASPLTAAAGETSNVPHVCVALLASITTGGATYAFGFYGSTLKRNLHLTQSELDTISTATFFAGLLSWLPGLFIDRYGTRLGISIGGLTGSISLMLYWVISKGFLDFSTISWTVAVLSALGVILFLSCALVTGSVFKIISQNCGPGTKGAAVGVAKGYVGLGSGAYATLFEKIRSPTSSDLDFLPMAAFFFLVAAALPSWIILPTKEKEGKLPDALSPLHFRILYSSLIVLAVIIVSTSLTELYEEEHGETKEASPNHVVAAAILLAWIGPILIQTRLPRREHIPVSSLSPGEDEEENLLLQTADDSHGLSLDSPRGTKLQSPTSIEDESMIDSDVESSTNTEEDGSKTLTQMLQTSEAWLMIWTTTILVGAGTVETNNLGQMVESLGFSPVVTSASLALFSVAQAAGRVSTGTISENAITWNTKRCFLDKGVPRPFFLLVASVLGVFAHGILATSSTETSFVTGVLLSGFSFGMVWPLMVLIVGELFGTSHFGSNYLFYDGATSAFGTVIFSKILSQEVYEHHIGSTSEDGVTCYGKSCFGLTHIVVALLASTCIFTSLFLQYITRNSYNK